MGQAAIDLPNSEQAPAPLTSADDLLSQLAGQEIDQLLADADPAPAPVVDDIPAAAQAIPNPELEELLKTNRSEEAPAAAVDIAAEIPEADLESAEIPPANLQAAPPAAAATPESIAETDEQCAAEIDELFKQLDLKPEAAPPPPPAAPIELPAEPVAAKVETPAPAKVETPAPAPTPVEAPPAAPVEVARTEPEEQTTPAERAALTAALPTEQPAAVAAVASASVTPAPVARTADPVDDRLPLLVRVLEMVNLPFSTCSDLLRDTLGKIAILTLMNAIGVFLYVILFRR